MLDVHVHPDNSDTNVCKSATTTAINTYARAPRRQRYVRTTRAHVQYPSRTLVSHMRTTTKRAHQHYDISDTITRTSNTHMYMAPGVGPI